MVLKWFTFSLVAHGVPLSRRSANLSGRLQGAGLHRGTTGPSRFGRGMEEISWWSDKDEQATPSRSVQQRGQSGVRSIPMDSQQALADKSEGPDTKRYRSATPVFTTDSSGKAHAEALMLS